MRETPRDPTYPVSPPTARQQEVLDYVAAHALEHGKPPTIQEIGRALAVRSTSGVHRIVSVLVERGLLTRTPRESRGLALASAPPPRPAPPEIRLVAGYGPRYTEPARGEPTLLVDPRLLGDANPADCLAAPAGDDLPAEAIRRGDLLVIHLAPGPAPGTGELVAVHDEDLLVARTLDAAGAPVGRVLAVVRRVGVAKEMVNGKW